MNEPAFPQVDLRDHYGMLVPDRQPGMLLRDYFAAHATEEDICVALDSVRKVEKVRDLGNGQKVIDRGYPDNARQIARYIHADLMMKAREQ